MSLSVQSPAAYVRFNDHAASETAFLVGKVALLVNEAAAAGHFVFNAAQEDNPIPAAAIEVSLIKSRLVYVAILFSYPFKIADFCLNRIAQDRPRHLDPGAVYRFCFIFRYVKRSKILPGKLYVARFAARCSNNPLR